MKIKQFIYFTTVFSLIINTIISILFPQSSVASTKNHGNLLQDRSSTITSNEVDVDRSSNNSDFLNADRSFSWSNEQTFQIAQQAYQGKASWYGPKFHGRLTANGEVYNSNSLTAAHRYLPFGTKVRVTNLINGRSVIVRINDRGPFIKGRIIDVSAGAARTLNMIHSGVANVQIEILGR
ncbi:hypothetical protein H1P_2340003 [Hyella patelloides LEGE 07179]|uniref:Probable endolytic peptidoglycan transglycosylase RlpA n=1 Tax=Hyella patelloides LEGE 07179 TaxID=945734 RepID=A0A563VRK0_9CYAN|nr:septal ring lytic transglycosylase RlpA family protein [Hyella patelloides]VEP14043.1 hypothetical protein H1P_2340003 [Hyella patelloides LEGE 07179]